MEQFGEAVDGMSRGRSAGMNGVVAVSTQNRFGIAGGDVVIEVFRR
jgi:hypothetical protein